jgi:hypothetical protein
MSKVYSPWFQTRDRKLSTNLKHIAHTMMMMEFQSVNDDLLCK